MLYTSKRKIKKIWKPIATMPQNEDVWLAMAKCHPDGKRPSVIGRSYNSWTAGGIKVNGSHYNREDFVAWTNLKEPIEYKIQNFPLVESGL